MNTKGIFNFSIYKANDGGDPDDEMIFVSFNLDDGGCMPDHFEDDDAEVIEKLFKSVGLSACDEMEDCYSVEPDDVQRVGDAFVKAGLEAVVNHFNGGEKYNLYPLPDGSIPGKKAEPSKKRGIDAVDRKLLELMGGSTAPDAAVQKIDGKVTTEHCVEYLVKNVGGTNSDWKRRSKKKQGKLIVRAFENTKSGLVVEVVEENGQINSRSSAEDKIGNRLAQLRANNIKVDFAVKPSKWFSGRVIFGEQNELEVESGMRGKREFSFFCGPEGTDDKDENGIGNLADEDGGCYQKLETLFADMNDIVFIGESENMHAAVLEDHDGLEPLPDITVKALWSLIKQRLICSGAVEMEE